ncbi:hypothetical protein KTO58_07865 [Chitinophaga pendula]|uniref:hypothetical protein n=1 Tax=Chitinophaga TaxID=79328 RepID=UPI000BAF9A0E|nr:MULTISPECIES: hypothetical protein [Chitinophaga]ASZ13291.1 hypothetical protein CK934_21170 [Chitinophaga sp. MD30]UCJ09087.1 hypothetical protein KTO58_07865 [Chitinophaga pendula]
MSIRSTEHTRKIAAELATRIAESSPDTQRMNELLDELGYDTVPKENKQAPTADNADRIGIYIPDTQSDGTYYVRDIAMKDRWSFFADIPSIPPKSERKRVVLLGESVARGFLLDPGFTPAGVLEQYINANAGVNKYEVIDLAETNLGMSGLKERCKQALALQPDIILILAGNNWRDDLVELIATDSTYYQTIGEALSRREDTQYLKAKLEEIFSELVRSFLSYLNEIVSGKNIPVIFAIPEFNLLHCRSTPGEKFVSRLAGSNIADWLNARTGAEAALAENELDRCITYATEMISLDPSHPYGYELLAECNMKMEKWDEARQYLEQGRDTAIFCRTNSKPRMYSIIRETILKEAARYNINVLDIAALFKSHLKGKIPGSDLFLDYCHFTAEGTQLVAEAIAGHIFELNNEENKRAVAATAIKPEKDVSARAHFFAAIHNAHWGQSYDILYHHCIKALYASQHISRFMIYYCDMISRSTPNNLCKTLATILTESTGLDRYVHALIHPRNAKSMELELVDAIIAALKKVGVNIQTYIDDLRKKEHSVEEQQINLLDSLYHATSYDEYQGTKTACFQARDNYTRFYLVASKGVPVSFNISLRMPEQGNAPVRIPLTLNDQLISELEIDGSWTTCTLTAAGDLCKDGINTIGLHWPAPAQVQAINNGSKRQIVHNIGTAMLDTIYYVFGEIAAFTVVSGKQNHLELN